MKNMLEYIKQLEEENLQLKKKLETIMCPSYAKVLQVSHSVASYYNNRMDDVEKTIIEKMSCQLSKHISTPEFSVVDTFKESYSGNVIYRMRCHVVPM